MMTFAKRVIEYCLDHPVLANVAMMSILVLGALAARALPVQFLPDFNPEVLVVIATRDQASSEEMREEVMQSIDPHLYGLAHVESIEARARPGVCFWVIRFSVGESSQGMVDRVMEKLANANLSRIKYRVERPKMRHPVLSLVMVGPQRLSELAHYAHQAKLGLLSAGVDYVQIQGLEKQDTTLTISSNQLVSSGLKLQDIADQLEAQIADTVIDASTNASGSISSSTHGLDEAMEHTVIHQAQSAITSSELLKTEQDYEHESPRVFLHNQPAVSLIVSRNVGGTDIFTLQKYYQNWLSQAKARWGDLIEIKTFEETWKLLAFRIQLLVENGFYGLVLILILLGVFFHISLAKWIASGIPICIAASCMMLFFMGGTINFLSTFAFVMALGVIVDDTIVIAEQAYSEFQNGIAPRQAVINACRIMFVPIMAASLTTVASFIPLLVIPGEYGKIMIDIPRVIICVLIASIIECFLILPRHIRTALEQFPATLPPWQQRIQDRMRRFQQHDLKNALVFITRHAIIATLVGLSIIILPMILVISGRISFSFFPSPPQDVILMDTSFEAGVTEAQVMAFLKEADQSLSAVNESLSAPGYPIVEVPIQFAYQRAPKSLVQFNRGVTSNHASMILGLSLPDHRNVANRELIDAWQQKIPALPFVKNISITEPRAGPPVPDIKILIKGQNGQQLKSAAERLKKQLSTYRGVHGIDDNMPYGAQEYLVSVKDQAIAIGVDKQALEREIARQLQGVDLLQRYADGRKIALRIRLDAASRNQSNELTQLPVRVNGHTMPLGAFADIEMQTGFGNYYSFNGQPGVLVTAETSADGSTTREVIADLKTTAVAEIEDQFGVKFSFETQARSQVKALAGIKTGALIAVAMIYFVLAWVLKSYGWPLMVMLVIPIGLSGAMLGHYLLGMNMTILSIFGLFGLTGIVVNDAIILLHRFQYALQTQTMVNAMITACCERFRAVTLTTVTTVLGMLPLLLNKSLQAQFVIPLAVSLSAGLVMATTMLIILLPAVTALVAQGYRRPSVEK